MPPDATCCLYVYVVIFFLGMVLGISSGTSLSSSWMYKDSPVKVKLSDYLSRLVQENLACQTIVALACILMLFMPCGIMILVFCPGPSSIDSQHFLSEIDSLDPKNIVGYVFMFTMAGVIVGVVGTLLVEVLLTIVGWGRGEEDK